MELRPCRCRYIEKYVIFHRNELIKYREIRHISWKQNNKIKINMSYLMETNQSNTEKGVIFFGNNKKNTEKLVIFHGNKTIKYRDPTKKL